MSYEVLARKWRPRSFDELVGQEHVRRALTNALDRDRLHHAYLFTGTRGVGKTTIARILAKSLNCETHGVTSTPCGECAACREIDAGRFIDLIEVDAASRTRVDETRELLENVPYAPTRGRYKVYLIDEVHMFSGHSFNALLKTLEEPPPHVKFLLATTDPQKVPVTILSRCLQFNLKLMPVPAIVGYLERIAAAEQIDCDAPALGQIARAATGSMRDALSLLDQAVAYGQGEVRVADVEAMLGTLSRDSLFRIVEALSAADGPALLAEVEALAQSASDLEPVLVELQALLHQIAIAQTVPDAVDPSVADAERVHDLARAMQAAEVQLYHQIATLGRRDMTWAPDARSGLEMTLLRMLTFRPAGPDAPPASDTTVVTTTADAPAAPAGPEALPTGPEGAEGAASGSGPADRERATAEPAVVDSPGGDHPGSAGKGGTTAGDPATGGGASATVPSDSPAGAAPDWSRIVGAMNLRGLAGELAANTALISMEGREVRLGLAPEHAHLGGERYRARLEAALGEHLGREVRVKLQDELPPGAATPAELEQRAADERVRAAEERLLDDPVVQALQERFDATVESGSVRPVSSDQAGRDPD